VEREAFVMEMVVGPTGSWYRPPAQPTDVSGTFLAQDGDNGGTTPTRAKSITTLPPPVSFFYPPFHWQRPDRYRSLSVLRLYSPAH